MLYMEKQCESGQCDRGTEDKSHVSRTFPITKILLELLTQLNRIPIGQHSNPVQQINMKNHLYPARGMKALPLLTKNAKGTRHISNPM